MSFKSSPKNLYSCLKEPSEHDYLRHHFLKEFSKEPRKMPQKKEWFSIR